MKKIVYSLLFVLCLPIGLMAQSIDDDLYFVPSKSKQEKKEAPMKKERKEQVGTNIYTAPGTTVVIKDRRGNKRDVDEYNRRYNSRENDFVLNNDTLYVKEKKRPDLEGEWVDGQFNGTRDDYEYAERIIRFRNPRFAISISSPFYWDVVYGVNSWDWNVYSDGLYAYAFPTFSNPLWWDWRYNSHGWGWNRPYYYGWGYYPGYWGGWNGGYWGGWYGSYWGHNYYYDSGWGWNDGGYWNGRTVHNANSRSRYANSGSYYESSGQSRSYTRSSSDSRYQTSSRRDEGTSSGRVVGTRSGSRWDRTEGNSTVRPGMESSRRGASTYTRPSSTRSYSPSTDSGSRYSEGTSSRRSSSYSRGSSDTPSSRTYSGESSRRSSYTPSYTPSRSSSSSYESSSGGSSRSSGGGGYSGGGSSRSSGGGSSSGSSRR